MRMLEGEAVRRRGIEGRALAIGNIRNEIRVVVSRCYRGTLAAQQVDRVGLQIVRTGAGTLVGVGDSAAALETPLSGRRNRSINPARSRGWRRDDQPFEGS